MKAARLLFIDHRDSFSGNLVALLQALGACVHVLDDADLPSHHGILRRLIGGYDGLVLSPGPGHPSQYPQSAACYRLAKSTLPILGVCLGLQIALYCEGGVICSVSERPIHGRREYLKKNMESRWPSASVLTEPWVFFNSLGCPLSDPLFSTGQWRCVAGAGGYAAWVEHAVSAILLTQFHPESFASPLGSRLIACWLQDI